MKQSTFVSIVVPIVATIVMMVLSILGLQAQNTKTYTYTNKISRSFRNNTNEFLLYGVGQVILKTSSTQTISCVVNVTGYGKSVDEAKERTEAVEVSYATTSNGTPELHVNMKHGRYNKRKCKVVTTVYLPNNVTFQHNEDINVMEIIYRIIDEFK